MNTKIYVLGKPYFEIRALLEIGAIIDHCLVSCNSGKTKSIWQALELIQMQYLKFVNEEGGEYRASMSDQKKFW